MISVKICVLKLNQCLHFENSPMLCNPAALIWINKWVFWFSQTFQVLAHKQSCKTHQTPADKTLSVCVRTPSEWQLAGPEGSHAWSRRCVLRRRFQRWNRSCWVCAQRRHDLCRSKAGQHQIPFTWGMCTDLIVMDNVSLLCRGEYLRKCLHVWSNTWPSCPSMVFPP